MLDGRRERELHKTTHSCCCRCWADLFDRKRVKEKNEHRVTTVFRAGTNVFKLGFSIGHQPDLILYLGQLVLFLFFVFCYNECYFFSFYFILFVLILFYLFCTLYSLLKFSKHYTYSFVCGIVILLLLCYYYYYSCFYYFY